MLERRPYQDRPLRYDYLLTEKGRDLWTVLAAMRQWGDRWEAPGGVPVATEHRGCGHLAAVVPTCSHCGERLEQGSLRLLAGPGATPGRPPVPIPLGTVS